MSAFWALVRLRLRDTTRRTSSLVFVFGLPLLLLGLTALLFAGGHPFERRHVAYVGGDAAPSLPGVALDRADDERAALARLDGRMASAAVLGRRVVVGEADVLFGRGIAATLPGATLEVRPSPRLGYVRYLLPGLLTFSVLVAGLYGVGYAMLRYRDALFLRKLRTTRLPRATFIAAQLLARTLVVVAQSALLLAVACAALGVTTSTAALAWLAALTVVGVLTFTGVGFALAALVRSEATLPDVLHATLGPLVLLSELFFPTDALPAPFPQVSAALPTTQMVRLSRHLLLEGRAPATALATGLAVMGAWMLASFALAWATFRWEDDR